MQGIQLEGAVVPAEDGLQRLPTEAGQVRRGRRRLDEGGVEGEGVFQARLASAIELMCGESEAKLLPEGRFLGLLLQQVRDLTECAGHSNLQIPPRDDLEVRRRRGLAARTEENGQEERHAGESTSCVGGVHRGVPSPRRRVCS